MTIADLSLKLINERDTEEFSRLYEVLYSDMYNFASRVYSGTPLEAPDVINDIFLSTWSNRKIQFQSIGVIKSYFIRSVRNGYNDYIRHGNRTERYRKTVLSEQSYVAEVAETEVFSLLSHAVTLLPEQCAKVFSMWVTGWSVRDIAQQLNKTESTVYSQKQAAIDILRQKMGGELLAIIFLICSYYFTHWD